MNNCHHGTKCMQLVVGSCERSLMAVLTTPFSMHSPEVGVPYGDVVPEGHAEGEPDLAGQNDP